MMLATGNVHKLAELRALLESVAGMGDVEILTPEAYPEIGPPEEFGVTFEENAALKAQYWAQASGLLALADDSGLVVDALAGRPGVYSARYAADAAASNRRVLEELSGKAPAQRTARFVCVAALADPDGRLCLECGHVEGRIAAVPRGEGGFGYDPIFEPAELAPGGRTMAEVDAAQKNAISHRGRAMRAIADALARSLAAGRVAGAMPNEAAKR
jgi:XTP/dITP diphosphohydrolase